MTGKAYIKLLFLSVLMILNYNSYAQFFPPIKERHTIAEVALYKEANYAKSYLLNINLGREYRLRTWFTFGLEGNIYKFTVDDYSTVGAGIRPITRIYFWSKPKFEIFGESKGGVIIMFPQYPDKAINFTFIGNLGVDLKLFKYSTLRITGGYSHFSNGKEWGDIRNPTWDGYGMGVGFIRKF